jgi:alpha-amylase/alpha-mannosidase (GH57 family)
MARYLCFHGHFYQPPRDDPWTGRIPRQPSAAPFHDWNERVWREAYGPNSRARLTDARGRILDIQNNYGLMSFNFGPTLLTWLEEKHPRTYQTITRADRMGKKTFGSGGAMAQAYGHLIMPLANPRDRITQIRWGLRDFEARFGRKAAGMWLPETAVDGPTLEALADNQVGFVILSPHQARRTRPLGGRPWQDVTGGKIDTRRAYRVLLSGDRRMDVLFYQAALSQGVAFEGLLKSGEEFAARIKAAFDAADNGPQLILIATDGESFGHHHKFGDMALAYVLNHFERHPEFSLTIPERFLADHPPTDEVDLIEPSSWSCSHGVGRWEKDCGCNVGQKPGWDQKWRAPLRQDLDRLRDQLVQFYETVGQRYFRDVWAARDDYIELLIDPSLRARNDFFRRHGRDNLTAAEEEVALALIEMQHRAMEMFTSCGWFFDDITGLEAEQVLRYAYRAVEIVRGLGIHGLTRELLTGLAQARANDPPGATGADVLRAIVAERITRQIIDLLANHGQACDPAAMGFFTRRARAFKLDLDRPELAEAFTRRMMDRLDLPADRLGTAELEDIKVLLGAARRLRLGLDPWLIQNAFSRMVFRKKDIGLKPDKKEMTVLNTLARKLGFHPNYAKTIMAHRDES